MLKVLDISELKQNVTVEERVEESKPDTFQEKKIDNAKAKPEFKFRLDCGLNLKDFDKIYSFLERKGLDSDMLELTSVCYEPHFYRGATHIYKIRHRQMNYNQKIELIRFLTSAFPSTKPIGFDEADIGFKYG